jgi:ubiquinone/menaquinone biosynthesis C-methylase UbiE
MREMTESGENWNRAYREAPEIFDAFCRAEDPDGRISRRLEALANLDGKTVLEIGCGTGRYTVEWARSTGQYVAVESSPAMLALARSRCSGRSLPLDLLCGDAARLPFPDATFDRVLAGWVVVNLRLPVRRAVLSEVARVLRPDGDGAIWLVENHWGGGFQQLRGRRAEVEEARIERLSRDWGFETIAVLETELRFASEDEAARVLGWLCGERVKGRLRESPTDRMTHHVTLMRRTV